VLVGLARPLALIVPLSLIGVWAVVRLSTTSLRRFRSEIERRGAGDLTAVPAGDLPSEIQPVAQAVNQLLERLRRALEAERSSPPTPRMNCARRWRPRWRRRRD
jgi:two-component system OmpR family sensor kinase